MKAPVLLLVSALLFPGTAFSSAAVTLRDYLDREGVESKLLDSSGEVMSALRESHQAIAQAETPEARRQAEERLLSKIGGVLRIQNRFRALERSAQAIADLKERGETATARTKASEFRSRLREQRPDLAGTIKAEEIARIEALGKAPSYASEFIDLFFPV